MFDPVANHACSLLEKNVVSAFLSSEALEDYRGRNAFFTRSLALSKCFNNRRESSVLTP